MAPFWRYCWFRLCQAVSPALSRATGATLPALQKYRRTTTVRRSQKYIPGIKYEAQSHGISYAGFGVDTVKLNCIMESEY